MNKRRLAFQGLQGRRPINFQTKAVYKKPPGAARLRPSSKAFDKRPITGSNVGGILKGVGKELGKSLIDYTFEKAAPHIAKLNPSLNINIGGKSYTNIDAPSSNASRRTVPAMTMNSVKAASVFGTTAPRKTYKTQFDSGRRTSSGIKMAAKLNGYSTDVLFDTKLQIISPLPISRAQLNFNHGFNSRQLAVLPARAYVNSGDLFDLFNLQSGDRPPLDRYQRVYASIMKTSTDIVMYNQSTFFPITVKVHLIDVDTIQGNDLTQSISDDFATNIWPRTSFSGGTSINAGQVPLFFLHGEPQFFPSTDQSNEQVGIDMSLKTDGLTSSPYFREKYKIVKTFSKKLNPSDTWNFHHDHHHGGGIDVYGILTDNLQPGAFPRVTRQPASYFYIIESYGVPCEGIRTLADEVSESYLGTSPGYFNIEYRKSITSVNSASDTQNITLFGLDSKIHVRVVENDPAGLASTGIQREVFADPADITNATFPSAGQWKFPNMSDQIISFQNTQGRGAENPD